MSFAGNVGWFDFGCIGSGICSFSSGDIFARTFGLLCCFFRGVFASPFDNTVDFIFKVRFRIVREYCVLVSGDCQSLFRFFSNEFLEIRTEFPGRLEGKFKCLGVALSSDCILRFVFTWQGESTV